MLLEKISALAIMAIVMTVIITLFPQYQYSIKEINKDISVADSSIEISKIMENVCVQYNTFLFDKNSGLACLSKGNCTTGQDGSFYLVDKDGKIRSSSDPQHPVYYNSELDYCENCEDTEGLNKLYKLQTSFQLKCRDSCDKEPVLDIEAQFIPASESINREANQKALPPLKFSRKITVKRVFKSCTDAYQNGNTVSGLFNLDFDGPGGLCPAQFYCDMNLGKPRVLVANATTTGYTKIPEISPPLMLNSVGRIQDEYLLAMLSAAPNYEFTVGVANTQQGDLTFNFSNSGEGKGLYSTKTSVCAKNNTNVTDGSFTASTYWAFSNEASSASIGYSEKESSTGKIPGFHCLTCTSTTSLSVCGFAKTSCCKGNLAGSLWMSF